MSDLKAKLFQDLSDAVVDMDEDKAITASHQVIANQIDAFEAIDKGLINGMERAGQLFEDDEYFVPELLICADAMYASIDILKPHIKQENEVAKSKVVIGVIQGDTHDIGKNLVKLMLETAGFEVYDLGRDVPPEKFVEKARETGADLIAISTLMITTMDGIAEVFRILNREGIRDQFRVIIGGAPISQAFANKIGADGYAKNASEASRLAKHITENDRIPVPVA